MKIVLLPGLDGTGDLFAPIIKVIEPAHKTHVISYPAHKKMSYPALAEVVLSSLPIGQDYVILAESFSGPVALSVAAQKPKGLRGIILCCSFIRNPQPALSFLSPLISLAPIKHTPSFLVNSVLLGKWSSQSLTAELGVAIASVPSTVLRSRLKQIVAIDVTRHLKSLAIPLLYLQASCDRIVPAREGQYIRSILAATQLVSLAGPHALLQARPFESAVVIHKFMSKLDNAE